MAEEQTDIDTSEMLKGLEGALGLKPEPKPEEKTETVEKPAEKPAEKTEAPKDTNPDKMTDSTTALDSTKPATPPDDVVKRPDSKPEEKTEEVPVEKPQATEDKDARAYAQMRVENERLQKQLAEIQAKQQNSSTEIEEKLKTLEKERNEALDLVGKVNLAASPQFRREFDEPMQALLEHGKGVLKSLDLEEGVIERAANMNLKARLEYLKEAAPDAAVEIRALLTDYDTMASKRQAALDKHAETANSLNVRDQQEQQQKILEFRHEIFQKSLTDVLNDGHYLLKESEKSPEWNNAVSRLKDTARTVITSEDPSAQAKFIVMGAMAPVYKSLYEAEMTRREKAEAEAKKLAAVDPKVESRTDPSTKTAADKRAEANTPMSPDEMADSVSKRMDRYARQSI